MKFGTTISLDQTDLEKLDYISDKCGFQKSGKGLTGIIRLAIQKAYAHQMMIEGSNEKIIEQKKLSNGERKVW